MGEISNRTILALLIATLVISLGGTYISLSAVNNKLVSLGLAPITGFATIPNGTATVTVNTISSIQFSKASVAFGSGNVNTPGGYNNCTLTTLDEGNSPGCSDFNNASGFTVVNDGNANLSVELRSNISAANFISGSAVFAWNVSVNESGSCVNSSGSDRTAVQPNTSVGCGGTADACGSIFESVSTSNKNICPSLLYSDTSDALNIDINITIPLDAPTGAKTAALIVTGTAES
ncbi:MAG: hypothetical protein QGI89_04705 [Candidatus Woesearchaeota archaeon]|nr:hypothetical protein [Candidatus Woesearchaeota archaeon]